MHLIVMASTSRPAPLLARIGFCALFCGGAWLAWTRSKRWFKAIETARPNLTKALRVERIVVAVLCWVMVAVGLSLLAAGP